MNAKTNRKTQLRIGCCLGLTLAIMTAAARGGENYPRSIRNILEAQIALDRLNLSCGSLDGALSTQTQSALRSFQTQEHLQTTGQLDEPTKRRLRLTAPPLTAYAITAVDIEDLTLISPTWEDKSQQKHLGYESILEMLAERGHGNPKLIRQLNPNILWARITAGMVVNLPNVQKLKKSAKAASVLIALGDRTLEAYDAQGGILGHFPCSIASLAEKRLQGSQTVTKIARHPVYIFDPKNFPEASQEPQTRLVIPPGPNNPVGTVWIGLNAPGYGIHGTPHPEDVGRTGSHGCFRLANWNAEKLADMLSLGTPVLIEGNAPAPKQDAVNLAVR